MKIIAFLFLLTLTRPLCSQTVKQLYDEYRQNKAAFENKYRNQTITITGKIRSISRASDVWKDQDLHRIHLTATGYENFVVCQLPYKDSAIIRNYKAGDIITVTGTVTSSSDALYLSQCSFLLPQL